MIFAYGNSKADWLAASVWIWMEFGLFHYFKAKMPKRWESGMKPKAVFFFSLVGCSDLGTDGTGKYAIFL